MDDQSITAVVAEIEPLLIGRAPGKIFQLSPSSMAIDFGLRAQGYLLLSVEPSLPRTYLIKRRVRDLEKQSSPLGQFALFLRKELSGTTLQSLEKDAGDRIVRFHFVGTDELGRDQKRTLVAQLTGRSANLFLLDEKAVITHQARSTRVRTARDSGRLIPGQEIGELYRPPSTLGPARPLNNDRLLIETIRSGKFSSVSEAADTYFTSLLSEHAFTAKASAARSKLRKKISRQKKLLQELQKDLATHADAEHHKRIGDLLLANLGTARREGNRVSLIDYFADDAPTIEIEVDEQLTLPEEASRRFELYSRSKRAVSQINSRLAATSAELNHLKSEERTLEELIERRDAAALDSFSVAPASAGASGRELGSISRASAGRSKRIPGTRRYISSEGFEVLVGRAARDNDHLTFKVAKPNDLWLHAADYGGSHVVIRNPTRKDIPHRTIIEAAQLAAHFSQARKDPKVDVHYTQRKFISKPKGAAPGLVRMSRFKNITVEPEEKLERM
jgi:predicted ribosome quality control (RQC) complex YloA/Tae2 family protein